jgi:hypothetical protein
VLTRKSNSTLESPIRSSASQRRKTKADLYTALLAVALAALLVAILFLYLYMNEYKFELKAGPMLGAAGVRQSAPCVQRLAMVEGPFREAEWTANAPPRIPNL